MNKSRLRDALARILDAKQNAPHRIPGLLGTMVGGVPVVDVVGRAGYVWVRLRGNQSDLVVAYNDAVLPQYGLAVTLEQDAKDPTIYVVVGRDVDLYRNWGAQPVSKHSDQHRFRGGDTAWIESQQIMPLLLRPSAPQSMAAYVEKGMYAYAEHFHWWPGSGTVSFNDTNAFITGGINYGSMMTVFLDMNAGAIGYLTGTPFDYAFENDYYKHVVFPTGTNQLPVGAILVKKGAALFGWDEILDLRVFFGR